MTKILVGIDGSERGERALEWAVLHAEEKATAAGEASELTLLTVLNSARLQGGLNEDLVKNAVEALLSQMLQKLKEEHPLIKAESAVVKGGVVDCLADAAETHDMVVVGSHHGSTIGQTIGGARGLRVAIAVKVPTVVVPADWNSANEGTGIVVAVGLDTVSDNAVNFGVEEAKRTKQPLKLVTAWGLPAFLNKPAEAMGGGLAPVGEQAQQRLDARVEDIRVQNSTLEVSGAAIEGSSPTRVLMDCSKGIKALVLGTHSYTTLGRTLFGSVVHSALLNLVVPTIVVPKG